MGLQSVLDAVSFDSLLEDLKSSAPGVWFFSGAQLAVPTGVKRCVHSYRSLLLSDVFLYKDPQLFLLWSCDN